MPSRQPPAPVSPLVTHVHSALLLSSYCLSFPSLVASPSSTLLRTLPVLTALQAGYAVLCLDPSGGSSSSSSSAGGPKAPRRPAAKKPDGAAAAGIGSRVLPAVLSLFLSSSAGTAVLYGLLVAFGAPLTSHAAETALCAAHLGLLVVFPLVYRFGVDADKWREVVGVQMAFDEAYGGAMGACVGAWLGAIPIPLDWDREWQKWPVTIVTGAYVGYMLGKGLGGAFRGTRIA